MYTKKNFCAPPTVGPQLRLCSNLYQLLSFQQRKILECLFGNKSDDWAPEFLLALESRKVRPDLIREIRSKAATLKDEQEEAQLALGEHKGASYVHLFTYMYSRTHVDVHVYETGCCTLLLSYFYFRK